MKTAPIIIVQLIHIEGPLKGQIVELSDPEIKIGRHPSCQLKYPANLAIISRQHAEIIREGNRFKLIDHSSNGTIVNGKKITEIFLKDGDVITVSEGGPKVSFLTRVTDTPAPQVATPTAPPPSTPFPPVPKEQEAPPPQPAQPTQSAPIISEPIPPQKNRVPLIIQYGPTLQSFDQLPLKIGKHPSNGFLLDHANILDLHAEIYFANEHYYIKDLTGRQMITTNGTPVDQGSILQTNDVIAFSQSGPFFRFLGNGRLSEEVNDQVEGGQEPVKATDEQENHDKSARKPLSFFKKVISKL